MDAKRVWVPALVIAVVVVVLAPAAHAALFLVFETNSFQPKGYEIPRTGGIGSPGDAVRAHTGGRGAMATGQVMPAFLARGAHPSKVESADDLVGLENLTPIGELRTGAAGNGHLSFETPELPSGEYEIVLFCESCAPSMDGANVVAAAPFRVSGPQTASQTLTDSGAQPPWMALMFFLAVALAFVFLQRHSSRRTATEERSQPS